MELLQLHSQQLALQVSPTQELASGLQRLLSALERMAVQREASSSVPGTPVSSLCFFVKGAATPPQTTVRPSELPSATTTPSTSKARRPPRSRCDKCGSCKAALSFDQRRGPCEDWNLLDFRQGLSVLADVVVTYDLCFREMG